MPIFAAYKVVDMILRRFVFSLSVSLCLQAFCFAGQTSYPQVYSIQWFNTKILTDQQKSGTLDFHVARSELVGPAKTAFENEISKCETKTGIGLEQGDTFWSACEEDLNRNVGYFPFKVGQKIWITSQEGPFDGICKHVSVTFGGVTGLYFQVMIDTGRPAPKGYSLASIAPFPVQKWELFTLSAKDLQMATKYAENSQLAKETMAYVREKQKLTDDQALQKIKKEFYFKQYIHAFKTMSKGNFMIVTASIFSGGDSPDIERIFLQRTDGIWKELWRKKDHVGEPIPLVDLNGDEVPEMVEPGYQHNAYLRNFYPNFQTLREPSW